MLAFFFLFCISKPDYSYDEPTQTLTVNACSDGGTSCSIIQTEFRNSGPYTTYKIIDIKFGPTSIESQAFLDCTALQEIKLSSTISSIVVPFCRGCSNIKKFTVEQSLFFEADEYGTLYSINKVKLIRAPTKVAVTIAPGTQIICQQAFSRAYYSVLTIPSSVTEIQTGCFYDGGIEKIVFEGPGSIKALSSEAMAIQFKVNSIEFPASLETIGSSSLRDCRVLKTITFPKDSNLTTISNGGISDCPFLQSITLPDKVKTISDRAFAGCKALESIHLSLSLETLSSSAFSSCSSLSSITITQGNKNFILEEGSFFDSGKTTAYLIAQNSTTFEIPDTLVTIGATSLQSCPDLTYLNVSSTHKKYTVNNQMLIDSTKKIVLAFIGGLTSVQIPSDIVGLGTYAGSMLTKLKHVDIPNKVEYIDEYCFSGSMLESIKLSSSVTEIRKCSFDGCTKLVDVEFPEEGAIKIMRQSFKDTSNLGVIDCKCNITSLEYQAFYGSGIKELYFRKEGFTETQDYVLSSTNKLQIVELPSSLELISKGCFTSSNVHTIRFGNNSKLSSIGEVVFQGCTNLKELSFGDKLKTILTSAFDSCVSLSKIEFHDQCPLTSITMPNIFYQCRSLKSVVLPRYIESIDPAIFYNCNQLIEVNASPNSAVLESYQGILYTKDNQLLLCPQGKQTADIAEGITSVGPRCFYQCAKLEQLIFPGSSVFSSLTDKMFYGCTKLQFLSLPKSIKDIADGAFTGCLSLTTILIGKDSQLSSITKGTFSSLTSLESINLDVCTYLKLIPETCFFGCSNLKKISLPGSLTTIQKSSFKDCTLLESVIFSSGTNPLSIEESTFEGCISLKSITIPPGCTSIGARSFYNTGLINEITIPTNVVFVGLDAFSGTLIRHVKYCGMSELKNLAFSSKIPVVHVPFDYPFNLCMGVLPSRDIDGDCLIQTVLYKHPLSHSSQLIATIVLDDDF